MESLSEEIWDVLIAGTSLPQSILALSLSHAHKKVLHIDPNSYYGGNDAGFSLLDAKAWVENLTTTPSSIFLDPILNGAAAGNGLGPSRAYTLSLNPQIIYAQSTFLPSLVSSQIHSQLEFLAVGSWFVLRDGVPCKIPSSREDVFHDDSLSVRDKRRLMKFLHFVLQEETEEETLEERPAQQTLAEALENTFNLSPSMQSAILALCLSPKPAHQTDFADAVSRIRRHMRSIGYFGPGFGAVIAKYASNAEIAQVACRAQAVGGGTYLLGHGLRSMGIVANGVEHPDEPSEQTQVILSDGTVVRARHVAGLNDDITPASTTTPGDQRSVQTLCSVSIISSTQRHLFPPTSENGPTPAVAIILVEDQNDPPQPPMYLQVHSEDTGECPSGQCIIYASLQTSNPDATTRARLGAAVDDLLSASPPSGADPPPSVLWSLSYISQSPASAQKTEVSNNPSVIRLPERPFSIAFEDDILDDVRTAWETVLGQEAEGQTFLRFEEREQEVDGVE